MPYKTKYGRYDTLSKTFHDVFGFTFGTGYIADGPWMDEQKTDSPPGDKYPGGGSSIRHPRKKRKTYIGPKVKYGNTRTETKTKRKRRVRLSGGPSGKWYVGGKNKKVRFVRYQKKYGKKKQQAFLFK